jgi:cytohesin
MMEKIVEAIDEHNPGKVIDIIRSGFDITQKNYSEPLIRRTIYHNKHKIAILLIENGINIDEPDGRGDTVLHEAINDEYCHMAELFVTRGANVNVKNNIGYTPLHVASMWGKYDIVKLLLDHGADIEAKNNFNETPVQTAISHGKMDVVKSLIRYGADMTWLPTYRGDTTAVSLLYNVDDEESTKILIEHGIDVNCRDDGNHTPLFYAVWSDNVGVAKLLLEYGTDVNAMNNSGEIPLVDSRSLAMTKLLIQNGANVNHVNFEGRTLLHTTSDVEIIKVLVDNGADATVKTNYNETVLFAHARNDNSEVLEFLVLNGICDVNERNERGETPLHVAVGGFNDATVSVLVLHGADVTAKDKYGNIPADMTSNEHTLKCLDNRL